MEILKEIMDDMLRSYVVAKMSSIFLQKCFIYLFKEEISTSGVKVITTYGQYGS